jgi:hypothetical protein|tara:strand:- start:232 stop:828 length:597 start_codon:yes stop_codon:yes gene_type:complete
MITQDPKPAKFDIGGVARLSLTLPIVDASKAIIRGMTGDPSGRGNQSLNVTKVGDNYVIKGYRHNAFTNKGLQAVLDSAYNGLTASRVTHIALSGDTSTVTASTTSIDPSSAGFSVKATSSVSRTAQTVAAEQTWSNSDVSFSIVKIGLMTGTAATDVVNIIGGTGGTAPYNEPFTIDLTSIATWSLTIGIDVTATAS